MGTQALKVPPTTYEEHLRAELRKVGHVGTREFGDGVLHSAVAPRIRDLRGEFAGSLVADVEEASVAIARYDARAVALLDEPQLRPLSDALVRMESRLSSAIEEVNVDAMGLALAELGKDSSDDASLVGCNVRALTTALALADDFSDDILRRIHAELLSQDPRRAGAYRETLSWVGGRHDDPRDAVYVAPRAELVPAAMNDLAAYLERVDVPAVAHAAIAHAQFETIHPFSDGNGRTGRALIQAVYRKAGLTTRMTVPVSAGLLRDTDSYFAALTAYRQGDAAPIVREFAAASRFAAARGMELVEDLVRTLRESLKKLHDIRSDAAARSVVPLLIGQPVVTSAYLREHLAQSDRAAFRVLDLLVSRGVLTEQPRSGRARIYAHTEVLAALDKFAAAVQTA